MSITPLPPAPAVTDTTSEFNNKAFNWVAALDTFTTETNETAEICVAAESTASAALAVVGAEAWVSGTTYAIGDSVYSPIDFQTYRRKTAGAGTTDPSQDSVNWQRVYIVQQGVPGQLSLVASGSLTNGDAVSVNIDGTISVISETTESYGSSYVFESANSTNIVSTYDSTNNKIVIAYTDNANSSYGTAVVGTIIGKTITFGTPVIFESASSTIYSIVHDSINNKIVIAYVDVGNSSYGTIVVGEVSGNSITFGTPVVFKSALALYQSLCVDTTNNRIVIAFQDNTASQHGKARVGTISGNSISFGSEVTFVSAGTNACSAVFDSNNSKVVIFYSDQGNTTAGTAIVGTVSGTSISFGTPVLFETSNVGNGISSVYCKINKNIVIAYNRQTLTGKAIVGTVSGTSISFGTSVIFDGNMSSNSIRIDFNNKLNRFLIVYSDQGNSGYGTAIVGKVVNNSILLNDASIFSASSTAHMSVSNDYVNNVFCISYRDSLNSNYGSSKILEPYKTTAIDFIGFSAANYNDGELANIKSIGCIVNNLTGLLPANKYYVQQDGTLDLYENDYTSFAGTAISSTELIVKG